MMPMRSTFGPVGRTETACIAIVMAPGRVPVPVVCVSGVFSVLIASSGTTSGKRATWNTSRRCRSGTLPPSGEEGLASDTVVAVIAGTPVHEGLGESSTAFHEHVARHLHLCQPLFSRAHEHPVTDLTC